MIPNHLLFIDLEATGANATRDRITEVGICETCNSEVIDEWSTLVNPEKTISPFIEHLTGISTSMVADSPTFSEIAEELQRKISGKVLVAHNARFDYGFLKNEFRRLNIAFQEKVLCTLKLSRALFPEHRKHNLDALIERHGLKAESRHRALGDARATQAFFSKISQECSPGNLAKAIQKQLKKPSLPPNLPSKQIEGLPTSPGVYLLYGENDLVLYVGKSVDIRLRVQSHFSGDHRVYKGIRLSQQVRRIDFIETAGELGALLLEARLIKKLSPIHNKRLRRIRELFSLRLTPGENASSRLDIVSHKDLGGKDLGDLFGVFRSKRQAGESLREIVRDQGLCNRVLGLEKGKGACFNYQIKKCRGACIGEEPLALHEARLRTALAALKFRSWPYEGAVGIREESPCGTRRDIHIFDHWRYLGTADSEDSLQEILCSSDPQPFDLDSYKILSRYLEKKPNESRRDGSEILTYGKGPLHRG